jgi:hypothetical protein
VGWPVGWFESGLVTAYHLSFCSNMVQTTRSGYATIEHPTPGITVVRFHADVKLNAMVLAEVMLAPRGSVPRSPGVMLVIPEHTDFDAHIMDMDHHAANGLGQCTASLAIVCHEPGLLHLLELYFAYYPPAFEVMYFTSYEDAHKWLVERATTNSVA